MASHIPDEMLEKGVVLLDFINCFLCVLGIILAITVGLFLLGIVIFLLIILWHLVVALLDFLNI